MTAAAIQVSGRLLQVFFGSVRDLPRSYWFLWAGSLINRLGSFVMPMLAVYLTRERHLSLLDAGTVVSTYGLGSLASVQLAGALADRIGRKRTMLISLVSSALAMLGLGFADGFTMLALAAFALGFTSSLYSPAAQAMLVDLVGPALRQKAFGLLYWAINLGFAIAAIVGGQLARWSFAGLFVADAFTTLVTALILHRTIPETRPTASPGRPGGGSVLTPLLDRAFVPFLLVHLSLILVFFQFQVALPADMQQKGLGPEQLGWVMALNGVLIVALQPYLTQRTAAWRRSRVLAVAALCVGFGFGLNAWAHNVATYMLAVALWTMGEILMAPANASVVADLSPEDMRGRYQGAFSLTWSLGVTLGPWLSGHIITAAGAPLLWAGCAVVGVLVAFAHLALGGSRRRRLEQLGVLPARD